MTDHVQEKLVGDPEPLLTNSTLVRFLTCVGEHVSFQAVGVSEGLRAG